MARVGGAGRLRGWAQGRSLRARLNLLVALCVLPLLAVTLAADYLEYRVARSALAGQTLNFAHSFADDIARLVDADVVALQTLALSDTLRDGRLDAFRDRMDGFLALTMQGAALGLFDPAGRMVLAAGTTAQAPGAQMLHAPLFGAGHPAVSGYQARSLNGQPGFCIGVPVRIAGAVAYALVIAPAPNRLAAIAAEQRPAPSWTLLLADAGGLTLGRWPHPERFAGRPVAPELLAAMRAHTAGVLARTTLEGEDVLAAYAGVPGGAGIASGWHVAISIPRREVEAPLRRTAILALTAGGALLLAGLVLAGMVARRITGPIARLQAFAAVPAHAPPTPTPTGLPETDAVAYALLDATAAREEALATMRALTDTLEQRVAQEVAAREAAQARAAQGERMQALGELAGGIAHDFNNVLQTMEIAAARLTRPAADAMDMQQAARLLGVAARHGAAITGRLLGFARRRPLAPAPLALAPLLTELAEMLQSTVAARVRLVVQAPPDLPPVLADRAQLETVLINLATNARDAMPNGGKLTFTAAEAPPPAALPPGRRYVALAAADTGPGMAPEVLARVTEPFFTTKPPGKGTGLGLALARSFAEQSGGTLTIASAPGTGTTVTLWLPVA